MMKRRSGRERDPRRAAYALAGLAIVAPQLLGGATELTQLAIVALAYAVAAYAAFAHLGQRRSLGLTPVAVLAAGMAWLCTLVQSLPIPCSWVAWAQPDRVDTASRLQDLGAIEVLRCSVSMAPGATRGALAMVGALVCVLLASVAVARAGQQEVLMRGVALSAIVMAFVGLGHAVLDAKQVFGIYTPREAHPRLFLAPLLNENHFAGLMVLGWPLCLASLRRSEKVEGRLLWGAGALAVFSAGLLSLSRGGAGALTLGGVSFLLLEHRSRNGREVTANAFATAVFGAAVAGFAAWLSLDQLANEFRDVQSQVGKLMLARDLFALVEQHPIAGIGRGALVDLSSAVVEDNHRIRYAENWVVQSLIDWGIPATVLMGALLWASLRRLRIHTGMQWALACGLGALALQNLVDFSLELAGVGCTAAISFGALLAQEAPSMRFAPRLRQALPWGTALTLGAAIPFVPWLSVWGRSSLQTTLNAELSRPTTAFETILDRALSSYPLDPMFFLLAANRALERNSATAPHWINLTMRAAPGWSGPHVQAAIYLERRGHLQQAALENGLAMNSADGNARACAFLKRHPSAELAWEVAAANPPSRHQASLEFGADCLLQNNHWDVAEPLLARVLADYPGSPYVHRRLVQAAMQRRDFPLALARARTHLRLMPTSPEAIALLAQALKASGQPQEAIRAIDAAPKANRLDRQLLMVEAEAAGVAGDRQRLDLALERLLARYGTTSRTRAWLLAFASNRLAEIGDHHAALARAQAAYDLSADPAMLELAHKAALKAGVVSVTLRTAAELCQVRHRGETYCPGAVPKVRPSE